MCRRGVDVKVQQEGVVGHRDVDELQGVGRAYW